MRSLTHHVLGAVDGRLLGHSISFGSHLGRLGAHGERQRWVGDCHAQVCLWSSSRGSDASDAASLHALAYTRQPASDAERPLHSHEDGARAHVSVRSRRFMRRGLKRHVVKGLAQNAAVDIELPGMHVESERFMRCILPTNSTVVDNEALLPLPADTHTTTTT